MSVSADYNCACPKQKQTYSEELKPVKERSGIPIVIREGIVGLTESDQKGQEQGQKCGQQGETHSGGVYIKMKE